MHVHLPSYHRLRPVVLVIHVPAYRKSVGTTVVGRGSPEGKKDPGHERRTL